MPRTSPSGGSTRTGPRSPDRGVFIREALEADLHAHGLDDPGKIYLVYYEGEVHGACANGPWPPTTPGTVAGIDLHGTVPPAPDCATSHLAGPGDPPGYWEFGAIHEVMHALGLVPECAPHAGLLGHVTADPRDLMYGGSPGGRRSSTWTTTTPTTPASRTARTSRPPGS